MDLHLLAELCATISLAAPASASHRRTSLLLRKPLKNWLLMYGVVLIEVSIPSSMAMLHNFPVETVVGSHLQAAVTMKAANGASFF
ncbi:hypothetical protein PIB30_048628 [Stylosanthes scabra]|uniref:Uncharacterized protein n=1 Tax=Stylosanthes scabra TaxID=79078 RepID=A0ABU6UJB0_9FABA|nr:hypothetical protein [Stylosanthes scabra]